MTPSQVNILVSQSRRAYIADFGLATVIHSTTSATVHTSTDKVSGTLRWQAPELLVDMASSDPDTNLKQRKTAATDIYAFGLVCYEVSRVLNSSQTPNRICLDVFWRISIPGHKQFQSHACSAARHKTITTIPRFV